MQSFPSQWLLETKAYRKSHKIQLFQQFPSCPLQFPCQWHEYCTLPSQRFASILDPDRPSIFRQPVARRQRKVKMAILQRAQPRIRQVTTAHLTQTMSLLELSRAELNEWLNSSLASNPGIGGRRTGDVSILPPPALPIRAVPGVPSCRRTSRSCSSPARRSAGPISRTPTTCRKWRNRRHWPII